MMNMENLIDSFGAFALMFCLLAPFVVNKNRLQTVYFCAIYVAILAHIALYIAIELKLNLSDIL